jgi:alcohol dehydrogenase (cytochrome c)
MPERRFASLLGLFVFLLPSGTCATAHAQGDGRGAQLFTANCSACHGADGKGRDKAAAVATTLGLMTLSDAELTRILHDGTSEGMPSFAQIGDANIAAAVRYLRILEADALPASAALPAAVEGTVARNSIIRLPDVTQRDLLQKRITENWVSYNGDYSGRRFSSLTQITPANVSRRAARGVFHVREAGPMEVTPVVAGGIMFVTSANDVYALDARTGTQLWHHARSTTHGLVDDASGHHNRGIAILGTRIYMETDNAHLLCLDGRSGHMLWDDAYAVGNKNYGATSAPLIVKDKVIVGTSGGDDGVRGFLAAFDAETGKEAWRFWTIPGPGEKGNESWPGAMYLHGGGTTWMPGTYDPDLNTLYWGTGNPAPDYDGSVRPGDDLYTSCLLALDPDNGKLRWYFQYSPHDLYDFDATQTPVLVDAVFQGRARKLIVTANRNGFLYVLDRTTGAFLLAKQFDRTPGDGRSRRD